MRIIAYTYEAGVHCPACAQARHFAYHYGLTDAEADTLIRLGRRCHEDIVGRPRPPSSPPPAAPQVSQLTPQPKRLGSNLAGIAGAMRPRSSRLQRAFDCVNGFA